MASIPLAGQLAPPRGLTWQIVEFLERTSSAVLLVALSPLLCLTAAVVAWLSGSTPLIAHRRVGWRGATLWMLKFRTMWDGTSWPRTGWIEYIDDEAGPQRKQAGDCRVVHGFAAFCRRHSIDELPQLVHVIRGEMSLVGPRPLTAAELQKHYGPVAAEVLEAKPGIAGLWQTSGRNRLSYSQRRQLDLQFVRTCSLRMYGKILLRTIPEIWSGANSW